MKKILALILCAALCFALMACGTSGDTETPDVTKAEAPAGSVEAAAQDVERLLVALKAGGAETMNALSGSDAAKEDELLLEMLVALFGQLEYEVGAPTLTGDDTATVPVEIKAVSITSVFTEYMAEAAKHLTDDNWDADGAEFIKICASGKVSKDTTKVDVNLERGADGNWGRGADNEAFIEALFGGLL